jgi:hyperosmotically inducible protein
MIRKETIVLVTLAVAFAAGVVHAESTTAHKITDLTEQVRREIATVPYSNVWDWIEAEVRPDGSVLLQGDVTRPSMKTDAESRVRTLESVSRVINNIHVLSLSYFDNEIRLAVYRSLFNPNSPLTPYALGSNPSIHIVVENGKVTLQGMVSSALDKQLASIAVNGVFGVHSVDNQLRLESES